MIGGTRERVGVVNASDVLLDAFGRLPQLVRAAVDGLTTEQLATAPTAGANTVGWLIWHVTRIQDDHVAEVMDVEQIWTAGGWAERFSLPTGAMDTGYGHSPVEVAAVRPQSGQALVDYYEAVHARTVAYLQTLSDADLDQIVDERWDPPVTLGVRLVSVVNDDVQHVGQAAYVRGLLLP
jgi:uncharacterized damage-inducible protein DinB